MFSSIVVFSSEPEIGVITEPSVSHPELKKEIIAAITAAVIDLLAIAGVDP